MESNPITVTRWEQGENGFSVECPNCEARISLFVGDGDWGGEEASEATCKRCSTTVKPVAVVVE